jgi:hypothetical protein
VIYDPADLPAALSLLGCGSLPGHPYRLLRPEPGSAAVPAASRPAATVGARSHTGVLKTPAPVSFRPVRVSERPGAVSMVSRSLALVHVPNPWWSTIFMVDASIPLSLSIRRRWLLGEAIRLPAAILLCALP